MAATQTDYDAELANAQALEQANFHAAYRKAIELMQALEAHHFAREAVYTLDAEPNSPDTRELMSVIDAYAAEWREHHPELIAE